MCTHLIDYNIRILEPFASCTSKLSPEHLRHSVAAVKIKLFPSFASMFSDEVDSSHASSSLLFPVASCFIKNSLCIHLVLATPLVHFLLRAMARCRSRSPRRSSPACGAASKSRARPHPRVDHDPPRDPRHPCTQCSRTFINEWALRQHLRNTHGSRFFA